MSEQLTIVIVGGLSAGPAAAAKARRTNEKARIILFEAGPNVSYATCGMPYAIGEVIEQESKLLVVKPELLRDRFQIEVKLEEKIIGVDPTNQVVQSIDNEYHYDKLIWATGASSVTPPIEGIQGIEELAHLRTLQDFQKIKSSKTFRKANRVTVVGGGLIGVELAENLIHIGKEVHLVEAKDQILPQWSSEFANLGARVLRDHDLQLYTSVFAQKVHKTGGKLNSLELSNGLNLETEYLILCAGIKPNSQVLADLGAATLPNGALIVNTQQETTLPNIYAAGDVASTWNHLLEKDDYLPLGTHSNKAGRTAGANAAGANHTYKGGYGTAIVQVFDHTLARTGASSEQLKESGIPFRKTLIHAGSTPGYYPNPENLTLEITYNPKTLRLYGAQAFGKVGVDKRIDVLSTAIYAKLTLDDLHELDLAYAPPFSPAKDPVVVAGFVAQNQTTGGCTPYNSDELSSILEKAPADSYQLIDLRNSTEIAKEGHIPKAINIPLDQLREKLYLVETQKRVLVYCAKGMRGYLGVRILRENGVPDSNNLAGGFLSWKQNGKPISHELY